MTNRKYFISLMLASSFLANTAIAQTDKAADQKAVRAEIESLTKRLKELSTQLDGDTKMRVIVMENTRGSDGKTFERRIVSTAPGKDGVEIIRADGNDNVRIHKQAAARVGLGIVLSPNDDGSGVKVAAVSPKGPAKTAGIQAGDILTSVDGKALDGKGDEAVQNARKALANLKEGQAVNVGYSRAGKKNTASVSAAKIQPQIVMNRDVSMQPMRMPIAGQQVAFATRWSGLHMADMNTQLGSYFGTNSGVLVLSQKEGQPQLLAGDVITKIDGKAVASSRDVMQAMHGKKEGDKIAVEIMRQRKVQTVNIVAPKMRPMNFPMPPMPPMPPAPPAPGSAPTPPAPPSLPRIAMFINGEQMPDEMMLFGDSMGDMQALGQIEILTDDVSGVVDFENINVIRNGDQVEVEVRTTK